MKTIDRLIEILSQERGERVPAMADEKKPLYFRALCNVREPKPVSEEFLRLQNEYLSARTAERGVVDVNTLSYRNGLALWQGDITRLNADAIVNACNSKLLGCFQPLHSCIDNCIHSFAGVQVRLDCNALMQGGDEPNGQVKVTKAYNLPSRYIFHTVGPIVYGSVTEENRADLVSCYVSCLNQAREMSLKSIAFCCLSTGVYGYPKAEACKVAVSAVRAWQAENGRCINVIFNVFTEEDREVYGNELR